MDTEYREYSVEESESDAEITYISDFTRFRAAMANIFPGRQTTEEEIADLEKAKAGDKNARDRLVAANAWLVMRIVGQFAMNGVLLRSNAVEAWDLLMEGQFGLYEAVGKYEEGRGARLATYASYLVKDRVILAITKSYFLTVGESGSYVRKLFRVLRERVEEVALKLGREPRRNELYSGLTRTEQRRLARAEAVHYLMASLVSIESEEFNESDVYVLDDPVSHGSGISQMRNLINDPGILSSKQRLVLKRKYLSGAESVVMTREIARELGITESAVSSLEKRGIRNLGRHLNP